MSDNLTPYERTYGAPLGKAAPAAPAEPSPAAPEPAPAPQAAAEARNAANGGQNLDMAGEFIGVSFLCFVMIKVHVSTSSLGRI